MNKRKLNRKLHCCKESLILEFSTKRKKSVNDSCGKSVYRLAAGKRRFYGIAIKAGVVATQFHLRLVLPLFRSRNIGIEVVIYFHKKHELLSFVRAHALFCHLFSYVCVSAEKCGKCERFALSVQPNPLLRLESHGKRSKKAAETGKR